MRSLWTSYIGHHSLINAAVLVNGLALPWRVNYNCTGPFRTDIRYLVDEALGALPGIFREGLIWFARYDRLLLPGSFLLLAVFFIIALSTYFGRITLSSRRRFVGAGLAVLSLAGLLSYGIGPWFNSSPIFGLWAVLLATASELLFFVRKDSFSPA